jgi:predicted nucleotidyltransferase
MDTIDLPLDEIRAYCATQPIKRLSLFGSALRGELRPDSDIDLLVEFLPDARVGLWDIVTMEMALTDIIHRKVDLRTPQELSRYFRNEVLKVAKVIYESA